jgi:hypothetical protein
VRASTWSLSVFKGIPFFAASHKWEIWHATKYLQLTFRKSANVCLGVVESVLSYAFTTASYQPQDCFILISSSAPLSALPTHSNSESLGAKIVGIGVQAAHTLAHTPQQQKTLTAQTNAHRKVNDHHSKVYDGT